MEIKIRIAKKEDAASLLEIYSYYVKNTAVSFEYELPSLEDFQKRITTTLQNYPYLLAEVDGSIAGYCYAGRLAVRAAFDWSAETSIYISSRYHRLGLGKLLYQKLEALLAAQNVTNLYARIAEPQSESDAHLTNDSQHFHAAVGYKLVGRLTSSGYKFNTWYNLIYMEKVIAPHAQLQKAFIPFSALPDPYSIL